MLFWNNYLLHNGVFIICFTSYLRIYTKIFENDLVI